MLLVGEKPGDLLERNFPGAIEDLPRSFFSTSVDLITARPVHLLPIPDTRQAQTATGGSREAGAGSANGAVSDDT